MTHVAIELPEEIAGRFGRQDEFSRVALEALAAEGYRRGKLTHAEVQRLLGFASRWHTDAFLKQAGAYLDYTESDLKRDLETSPQFARQ